MSETIDQGPGDQPTREIKSNRAWREECERLREENARLTGALETGLDALRWKIRELERVNARLTTEAAHMRQAIDEEVRCLGHLENELRGRIDGEGALKFFPVIDRAIDRLGESVKEYPTTMVKPQLRYVFARGETIAEQRDHVRSTPLYAMGDAKLVWVNEGDLWNLALRGVANPIDTGKPEL